MIQETASAVVDTVRAAAQDDGFSTLTTAIIAAVTVVVAAVAAYFRGKTKGAREAAGR